MYSLFHTHKHSPSLPPPTFFELNGFSAMFSVHGFDCFPPEILRPLPFHFFAFELLLFVVVVVVVVVVVFDFFVLANSCSIGEARFNCYAHLLFPRFKSKQREKKETKKLLNNLYLGFSTNLLLLLLLYFTFTESPNVSCSLACFPLVQFSIRLFYFVDNCCCCCCY